MSVNIGDTVKYLCEDEVYYGTVMSVSSSMDSYEEMELHDGVPYYVSKKLTAAENKKRKKAKLGKLEKPVFVPVKPKNMDSVFLEVKSLKKNTYGAEWDFILLNEVMEITNE